MTEKPGILAVDVCGTLYSTNTTAGLVIFHHARRGHRWRYAALTAMSRSGPLRLGLVVVAKLSGFDPHRALVLASLRGERLTALQASATRYVADHLPQHLIPTTHARMAQMRAAGWQPVLVSNAIAPVVEEIARQLDLPCIASRPQLRDAKLTGRLSQDLTGQKRKAVEAYLNSSLNDVNFAVITDNRSDGDLLAAADPAMLVAAGTPRKWMKDWDAETLCH